MKNLVVGLAILASASIAAACPVSIDEKESGTQTVRIDGKVVIEDATCSKNPKSNLVFDCKNTQSGQQVAHVVSIEKTGVDGSPEIVVMSVEKTGVLRR